VVIGDCGCWIIRSYGMENLVLRFKACSKHIALGVAGLAEMLYLDKVDSVSGLEEEEAQLWLT